MLALQNSIQQCSKQEYRTIVTLIENRGCELGLNKYSKGKIYKIVHQDDDEDGDDQSVAYVGSTCRTLKQRFSGHKTYIEHHCNSGWAQYVQGRGGIDKFKIKLIEDYPCINQDALIERERYYINLIDPICNVHLRDQKSDQIQADSSIQKLQFRSENYKCPNCSKLLSSSDSLKRHMDNPAACGLPHVCEDCHSGFVSISNLNRHITRKLENETLSH